MISDVQYDEGTLMKTLTAPSCQTLYLNIDFLQTGTAGRFT